jgi:TatD DNase family protein
MSSGWDGPFYDAHNHLQDDRLRSYRTSIMGELSRLGLRRMVVNGTCPTDWPGVADLAREQSMVVPCFGVHPWHVKALDESWFEPWEEHLGRAPAGVGEIGLDRWIRDDDLPLQEKVFLRQWRFAVARNLPVTIHCLKAWGRLLELLRQEPHSGRGFLLHSYGGPLEMVETLASLGAYFSISGHFALDRKARQREVFRQVPLDRLLVETDAPDMTPPERWNRFPLEDPATGRPINHPANIAAICEFAAELRGVDGSVLAVQVERNFRRLFGGLRRGTEGGGMRAEE